MMGALLIGFGVVAACALVTIIILYAVGSLDS